MKKYQLVMNGRDYYFNFDGTPKKFGFYQNVFLEALSPTHAESLVVELIKNNEEIKSALNPKDDPPTIHLDRIWELENFEGVKKIESGRVFYVEKKWWQFWKKIGEIRVLVLNIKYRRR